MKLFYREVVAPFFSVALCIIMLTIIALPNANALQKKLLSSLSLPYTIIPINVASDDPCQYVGYTEIELAVTLPAGAYIPTLTVFAVRNNQQYEVASVLLKEGIYRYPVKFFASDCTESLSVEFSY